MPKSNTSKYLERRQVMHKDFMPPITVEEFAAYLDGNLSDDEMKRVSSVIEDNESMQNISFHNQSVEENLADCESAGFFLPEELSSPEFEIPQFDDVMNFDNTCDELEMVACTTDTICDVPSVCDGSSTFSCQEENGAHHQTDCMDDVSDCINNDITQEHNDFENDISEIND